MGNRRIITVVVAVLLLGLIYAQIASKSKYHRAPKATAWDTALIEGNDALDRFEIADASAAYSRSLIVAEKI